MQKTIAVLALLLTLLCCGLAPASANYTFSERGEWPRNWPKELEPLRKQARTFVGPITEHRHYAIPFTRHKAFEAVWPYLLTVKTKGAPIFVVNGPNFFLGEHSRAGVIVHCPPVGQGGSPAPPEAPLPGVTNSRERWMNTTYLEVVVDEAIINWKRMILPKGVSVTDQRNQAKAKQP